MTRHNKVISLGRKAKGAQKVMTSEFGLCCKVRSVAWTTKRKGQPWADWPFPCGIQRQSIAPKEEEVHQIADLNFTVSIEVRTDLVAACVVVH